MASRYDDELWELAPEHEHPRPAHLVGFVRSLGRVPRALDLGCGDGRLTAELDAAELVAADVSPVALARAARRLPRAEIVELDPDAPLPLPDTSFDLVLCADMIEHVRDLQLLLSEVRRVLRPRARLAVVTPAHGRLTGLAVLVAGLERRFPPLSPHLRFLSRRSLRDLLAESGFEPQSLRRRSGSLLATAIR